jgi:hypothetical protein
MLAPVWRRPHLDTVGKRQSRKRDNMIEILVGVAFGLLVLPWLFLGLLFLGLLVWRAIDPEREQVTW